MRFQRCSGILLHPTSLPSSFPIGDLGPGARDFVDFLESASQSIWQVLPLTPTGYGDSPYQSPSAFAGNTLLISPDELVRAGLLDAPDPMAISGGDPGRVDFQAAKAFKNSLLRSAFERFSGGGFADLAADYESFKTQNAFWLNDFAVFQTIKESEGERPWWEWPDRLKHREAHALGEVWESRSQDIDLHRFGQFLFHRQWSDLRDFANSKGVRIVGDLPIFVARDSVDVWVRPSDFKLDNELSPTVVAGVPPDYFSTTGQLWGNPIYDWYKMRDEGFPWWVARMRHSLGMFDAVRIDHFLGFSANYEVPASNSTAEAGQWVPVPGHDLFATLKWALGELPLIAEDLGHITDDVRRLRDEVGLPGMKILQYAWGGGPANEHLPHNYPRHCVAYTGTHDNATVAEWFEGFSASSLKSEVAKREFDFCLEYLDCDGDEVNWAMIRALYASVADTVVVPLQDVFGSGGGSRMNVPSTVGGNWHWRFRTGELKPDFSERLARLSEVFGRR